MIGNFPTFLNFNQLFLKLKPVYLLLCRFFPIINQDPGVVTNPTSYMLTPFQFSLFYLEKYTFISLLSSSIMSLPILYPKPKGTDVCSDQISLLVVTFPLIYCGFWQSTEEFKPRARTHHVVVIVIIAMSTSCYFEMSRVIIILYYHTSMLTL